MNVKIVIALFTVVTLLQLSHCKPTHRFVRETKDEDEGRTNKIKEFLSQFYGGSASQSQPGSSSSYQPESSTSNQPGSSTPYRPESPTSNQPDSLTSPFVETPSGESD